MVTCGAATSWIRTSPAVVVTASAVRSGTCRSSRGPHVTAACDSGRPSYRTEMEAPPPLRSTATCPSWNRWKRVDMRLTMVTVSRSATPSTSTVKWAASMSIVSTPASSMRRSTGAPSRSPPPAAKRAASSSTVTATDRPSAMLLW